MMSDPALAALGAAWGNLQLGGEKDRPQIRQGRDR